MPMQATNPQVIETFSPPYLRGDGTCDVVVQTWVLGDGQTEWKLRGTRPETLSPSDVAAVLGTEPTPGMSLGDNLGAGVIAKLAENGQILPGSYIAAAPWEQAQAPEPAPQEDPQP